MYPTLLPRTDGAASPVSRGGGGGGWLGGCGGGATGAGAGASAWENAAGAWPRTAAATRKVCNSRIGHLLVPIPGPHTTRRVGCTIGTVGRSHDRTRHPVRPRTTRAVGAARKVPPAYRPS